MFFFFNFENLIIKLTGTGDPTVPSCPRAANIDSIQTITLNTILVNYYIPMPLTLIKNTIIIAAFVLQLFRLLPSLLLSLNAIVKVFVTGDAANFL